MLKKRRDRDNIMYDLLIAALEPVTRTRLIYSSFLSNSELRHYIAILVEKKMLEIEPTSNIKFKTTEEGRKFLNLYENMMTITKSLPNINRPNGMSTRK